MASQQWGAVKDGVFQTRQILLELPIFTRIYINQFLSRAKEQISMYSTHSRSPGKHVLFAELCEHGSVAYPAPPAKKTFWQACRSSSYQQPHRHTK